MLVLRKTYKLNTSSLSSSSVSLNVVEVDIELVCESGGSSGGSSKASIELMNIREKLYSYGARRQVLNTLKRVLWGGV